MWHVEARCANADAIISPSLSALLRKKYPRLADPDATSLQSDVLITHPYSNVTRPCHLFVNLLDVTPTTNNVSLSVPHLTQCPYVCLKYCLYNVHRAQETSQCSPLVYKTQSCAENTLITNYTFCLYEDRHYYLSYGSPLLLFPVHTYCAVRGVFFYSFLLPHA